MNGRDFCAWVTFTTRERCATATTFRVHVSHVVGVRAEEEVLWIYTGRVVAAVENPKPSRDKAIVDFPGDAGCPHGSHFPSY
jgi:hypothetical protein